MGRPKNGKVTWRMIYADFKSHFPRLAKKCLYWRPHDYATIEIWFPDNLKQTYNYDTKQISNL